MRLDLLRAPGALPKLVGHRGACDVAPENTMVSFERAWRDGADLIEFDIQMSADGHVVVMHDATLDRTTTGTGYVYRHSLEYLKRLDAGAWFGAEFIGERIPLLHDVLSWARGRIGLLIELKYHPNDTFNPLLVPQVLGQVQALDMMDQVAMISFQPQGLVQLKTLAPSIPTGPLNLMRASLRLAVRLAQRWPSLARLRPLRSMLLGPLNFTIAWACDVVAPSIHLVTPALVDAAHALGMPVSSGGFGWDYPKAMAMGVDTLAANNPGLVKQLYLNPLQTT